MKSRNSIISKHTLFSISEASLIVCRFLRTIKIWESKAYTRRSQTTKRLTTKLQSSPTFSSDGGLKPVRCKCCSIWSAPNTSLQHLHVVLSILYRNAYQFIVIGTSMSNSQNVFNLVINENARVWRAFPYCHRICYSFPVIPYNFSSIDFNRYSDVSPSSLTLMTKTFISI